MEESNKKLAVGGAIAAIVVAVGVYYFWPSSEEATPPVKEAPPKAAQEETQNYPVPEQKSDAPALPNLEDSDSLLVDTVTSLLGAEAVQSLIVKTDLARHIVVTVDNLPRKKVAERLKPVKPIAGKFAVNGPDGEQVIAPENAARYKSAVHVVETVDTQALTAAYFKIYPLLQKAYVDLGYPNGYFNNRLVEVIDHLLATPTPQGQIKVVQPNVMYEFADPSLEALSAGQKTLLRMGPENAAKVKSKLRELRAAVTAKKPG